MLLKGFVRALAIGLPLLFALPSCTGAAACDTSDGNNPAIPFQSGFVADGMYCTSTAHGPFLDFPGGRRYDVYHHLGFDPLVVQMYWSFAENGIGTDAEADTMTPANGNSAEIQLTNDQFIRIKNDSCAGFWVRVCAFGNPGDGG